MSIPLNETDKKIRDKRYISTKNGVKVFFVFKLFSFIPGQFNILVYMFEFCNYIFLFEKQGQ